MCVKDKLQEYLWINRNIEQLENELLVIESRVMKVTPTLSDLPKMKGYNDTLAENVGKMIELQNIINKNLNKLYGLNIHVRFNSKMVTPINRPDFFGNKEDDKEVDNVS